MGIQVCSNEGPRPFPKGDNYEIAKYIDEILKSSPQELLGQFNQTWQEASLGEGDLSFVK